MTFTMYRPKLGFLDDKALNMIHQNSLRILSEIGVRIDSAIICDILAETKGVSIDRQRRVAKFTEEAVESAIKKAPSEFAIHGRDGGISITFSKTNDFATQCTSGEYAWVDAEKKTRRDPTLKDLTEATIIADALLNIDIVGAMVQPNEVPVPVRDIRTFAELLKRTRKPVRNWVHNSTSAQFIMELFQVVAGGKEELRAKPRGLLGFEPTSPLIQTNESLETMKTWVESGQPLCIGPIVQSMGTGPITLAGTLTQQNAECLAGLVVVQSIAPGIGTVYFNGSLTMDPRTANTLFASPEQLILMAGGTQLAHRYGLPAGNQLGLTDAKIPDTQAGLEKAAGLLIGGLVGMNLTSSMGISGCDQGASILQLIIDNEIIGYVRRILSGFSVDEETCAFEAIVRVGIGGNFLTDSHTLSHLRERWIPRLSDRNNWSVWEQEGSQTMLDRAIAARDQILAEHDVKMLDEVVERELDRIVAAAERQILGE